RAVTPRCARVSSRRGRYERNRQTESQWEPQPHLRHLSPDVVRRVCQPKPSWSTRSPPPALTHSDCWKTTTADVCDGSGRLPIGLAYDATDVPPEAPSPLARVARGVLLMFGCAAEAREELAASADARLPEHRLQVVLDGVR